MTEIRKPRLLIVEDDERLRAALSLEFGDRGYEVLQAASTRELPARAEAADGVPEFAAVDLRLGADSGLEAVVQIRARWPKCRIVVMTGFGSIPTAVQAVKMGADNYLTKPVSADKLERALWPGSEPENGGALPDAGESLARHERDYIDHVLLQCDGNISRAARWLGVHRQSLQRKLKKYS